MKNSATLVSRPEIEHNADTRVPVDPLVRRLVYRVQDRNGRGPWKPGVSSRWVEPRLDHEKLLPWFVEWHGFDTRQEMRRQEYVGCGCLTLDQLRRWFSESEYSTLRRMEYRAYQLGVDRILRSSDVQCVFTRQNPLNKLAVQGDLYA